MVQKQAHGHRKRTSLLKWRLPHFKVTGYCLLVTFNCACARMILYGLGTDVVSAVEYHFFFEPKIAFSIYGSEET